MKNSSARVLPVRRTVGSIVRQSQNQGEKRDRQNNTSANQSVDNKQTTGNKTGSKNNIDPVCDICAQDVPGQEREKIYASGKCDHPVCYVCSARMRAICNQQECPICREKLDKVIFSANKTKPFENHNLKDYQYDDKCKIYFEDDRIRAAFEKLLIFECLECIKLERATATSKNEEKKDTEQSISDPNKAQASSTLDANQVKRAQNSQYPNIQKLRNHLDSAHKLRLCDLCLKHNKLFPFEYSYYSYDSLRKHIQKGELNTSHRGHPRCKLCDKILFNLDELLQHMSREHFHCHLCGRHNTTQHIYFIDYPSLRNHFKTEHFLCERDNCRHEQFTSAFDTQVDYQLHLVQVHDTTYNLSRGEARQHRTITLESTSHRQQALAQRDALPSNAAVITTGQLATANSPRRQIPESLQAQIIQQRLPSRADFPALGNAPNLSSASRNVTQQQSTSDGAGPSGVRASFSRSMGGHGRPPERLDEIDFPPLPENPKKGKSSKSKKSTDKPQPPRRPEEMTLDQLICSSLTLSARNNRANNKNKPNKSAKQRPIKIQL